MRRRYLLSRRSLKVVLPAAGLLILLAGGGFAALETDAVVGSYWEGVWWALSLMTTVGFVGRSPATTGGEVLSAVLMVIGFVLLALTTAAVASLFVEEEEEPDDERTREFERRALEELRALHERLDRLERRTE